MKKIKLDSILLALILTVTLTGCSSVINLSKNVAIGEGSSKGEVITLHEKSFSSGEFDKIDISTEAMNIKVTQSDTEEAKVELRVAEKIKSSINFDASIQSNELQITVNEEAELNIYDRAGERTLYISLPKQEKLRLNIENEFGNVYLENVTLTEATIELDAGDVNATEIYGDLDISVGAGEISIEDAIEGYAITANIEMGDIGINYLDAPEQAKFDLSTEIGGVNLSLNNVEYTREGERVIKGEIGSDGPAVKASSSIGDININ